MNGLIFFFNKSWLKMHSCSEIGQRIVLWVSSTNPFDEIGPNGPWSQNLTTDSLNQFHLDMLMNREFVDSVKKV